MNNVWILAQVQGEQAASGITSEPATEQETIMTTVASDPNAAASPARRPRGMQAQSWIFILLMFLVMYFLLFRGPRKQKQQHRQMVKSLQKNDRVRTIGGVIGTVVDIKGDEVTLKVDEANNTKIKVVSSAIGTNVSKDEK